MIRTTFETDVGTGRQVAGDVRIPDSPPPRSAIIVVHGFKGFKDWGFFPHLSDRLAAAGHAVVSFNFTGSGVAPGKDEVTNVEAFADNTLTRELDELRGVVQMIRDSDLLPRRPRTIGLIGHSRGGGDAILHVAEHGGVDALVTWAAVSTFDRWTIDTRREWRAKGHVLVLNTRTGRQLPMNVGFLDDFDLQRERFDLIAAAKKIEVPWLIVHGEDDITVRPEEGKALAKAARKSKLLLIEKAGHTFEARHPMEGRPPAALTEAINQTIRHFERHLGVKEG